MLDFLRELLFDVAFHSSEEEGPENRLELLHHPQIKTFVLIDGLAERVLEPFLEILLVGEDLRHQEVHEGPEFHNIVLKRGSSEEEAALGVEAQQCLPSLTFEVLDILSFIQDHVVPFLPPEGEVVLDDQLVRSDADVE